jgi:membrane protease YdiL (CAAX protease family)
MNIARKLFFDSETSQISPFWRGQLLLFDRPRAPAYSSGEGLKLLFVFFFLEVIVRPVFGVGARWLTIAGRDWWSLMQLSLLTGLACYLVISFARVHLSQLGLYSWLRWSKTEKFYLLQIVPITVVVFSFFVSASLKALWAGPHLWGVGLFIFVPKMIWGFYQEFLYRGVLQTELARRWGPVAGILASNLIFTFGPLHAYHFRTARMNPSHLWIFAAIFAIGLLFALVFRRSGNLWIVGIMHGLGDWFIDGLAEVSRMAS